jgi:hypothetical protein
MSAAHKRMSVAIVLSVVLSASAQAFFRAQSRGASPSVSARASAPFDLTGYWTSVVTQDWRWRMVTPARGDYGSIPITLEAKKAGDAWDPAGDERASEQCKGYGAPAIMAVPTRLRISWQDDNTLKVETDAGMQSRVFGFGASAPQKGPPTWQGQSKAEWDRPSGSLRVVTSDLRPGYLQKNGVPYGADAVVTEHWDEFVAPNGDRWLTITSVVEDAKYLRQPWVRAFNFRQERGGSKWDPTPCSAR